jgi:hypothetical protein
MLLKTAEDDRQIGEVFLQEHFVLSILYVQITPLMILRHLRSGWKPLPSRRIDASLACRL